MEDGLFEPDAFFSDAETLDAEMHPWGGRKFLVNGALMPDAEQTMAVVWILPGEEEPLHFHPNAEQLTHVLAGECELVVGDTMYHMEAGDTVRVPRNVPHQAACTGWDPVRLLATFSSPRVQTVFLDE